ncbi:hypothetical protein NDU88_010213 [Pleurodeles waltl]|uniref:Uncharacterized protein n=1 Tax=Pleurodeles waltl TaxID=8319 RepID=A0AAV7QTU7_PLEWA|nr:hypothetical protein NDU88_010213 [Pleurodeles waltl]
MAALLAALPWRIRPAGGKPAGNRRPDFLTAALPLRSEWAWKYRQPVGGASVIRDPGGQNDPLSLYDVSASWSSRTDFRVLTG